MDVIYCEPVPDDRRMDFVNALFGLEFPMRLEPAIYDFARKLSPDYGGGVWEFYALSNGGFYMAPAENGYEGTLSADAFGVTVCLYAYSHLSFEKDERFSAVCAGHFHRVREFALEHREAVAILAAID